MSWCVETFDAPPVMRDRWVRVYGVAMSFGDPQIDPPDQPEDDARIQHCSKCDEPTGRCFEDELLWGESGPLCEDCYEKYKCPRCEGNGWYVVAAGPNGEPAQAQCERCYGLGHSFPAMGGEEDIHL